MDAGKSLFYTEQDIRREIYGYSFVVDKNKKEALMDNLKQYSPGLILSEDWHEIEPLINKLCSMDHVKIVSHPNFVIFEYMSDPKGSGNIQLCSHPKQSLIHLIASFSGFVDQVSRDSDFNGIPKYYYIFNLSQDGDTKTVRYATDVTPHTLIDGAKKKA